MLDMISYPEIFSIINVSPEFYSPCRYTTALLRIQKYRIQKHASRIHGPQMSTGTPMSAHSWLKADLQVSYVFQI